MNGADVGSVVFRGMGDESRRSARFEEGSLVVREELAGPSARIAYGGDERLLKMVFSPEDVDELLAVLRSSEGCASVDEFIAKRANGVDRLMDVCDREGVAYTFISAGSRGDVQFRPSRAGVTRGSR